MRMLLCLCLAIATPSLARADVLSLSEFAVFEEGVEGAEVVPVRAEIVRCLQGTRSPRSCIGITLADCDEASMTCHAREAAAWERFGYDIYLALRRALGGPEWIDAAHLRIGGEMAARCASDDGLCQVREAAGRALDLRFALVAP